MIVVGNIEGHDVVFDPELDYLTCKGITVRADVLLRAYKSSCDRESMDASSEVNVVMRKKETEITLGCFTLTPEHSKQLIKTIKNERSKAKN